MYSKVLLVLICGLLVVGAACSKSSPETRKAAEEQEQIMGDQMLLKDVSADDIKEVIASFEDDRAVLVNVWATWCIPCVEEFPEIVEIQRTYPERLRVVFISADFPENRDKALIFLKEHDVDWTTYFKTGKDEPFINALSREWSGALPFSMVIDKKGTVIAHWENKADFDTFNKHVKQAINPR